MNSMHFIISTYYCVHLKHCRRSIFTYKLWCSGTAGRNASMRGSLVNTVWGFVRVCHKQITKREQVPPHQNLYVEVLSRRFFQMDALASTAGQFGDINTWNDKAHVIHLIPVRSDAFWDCCVGMVHVTFHILYCRWKLARCERYCTRFKIRRRSISTYKI